MTLHVAMERLQHVGNCIRLAAPGRGSFSRGLDEKTGRHRPSIIDATDANDGERDE